jgi:hypothetical protein
MHRQSEFTLADFYLLGFVPLLTIMLLQKPMKPMLLESGVNIHQLEHIWRVTKLLRLPYNTVFR